MRKLILTVCAVAVAMGASVASAQEHRLDDVVRNLQNPDPDIRVSAVRLLREAGHVEALAAMAPLVNDPLDEVQLEAIGAVLSFYLIDDVPAKRRVAFVFEKRSPGGAVGAFERGPLASWPRPVPADVPAALLKALDDGNERVRLEAIYTLGVIARPPLAETHAGLLVAALGHADPAVRAGAARVAGRLQVAAAADTLIATINDSDEQVRYAAMHALGDLREERAVQALTDQLTFYGKGEGASAALNALARIAHASSVPAFVAHLADKDAALRRAAMEGLGRSRDRSQIAELQVASGNDHSPMVRAAASFALQLLGGNYVARLADFMSSPSMVPQIAGYFVEIGPSVIGGLSAHLVDPNEVLRASVAQVLGAIGGEAAVAALQPLLQDPDPEVVQSATRALERIETIPHR